MNDSAKIENLLNLWKNTNISEDSQELMYNDPDYESYVSLYFNVREDKSFYKTKLINRLEIILKQLNASATDYIDESIIMWAELKNRGCEKSDLSTEKYPLSVRYGERVYCALCNYGLGVKRSNNECDVCPVEWGDGSCKTLYNKWWSAKTINARKKYANLMLDEIRNKRLDFQSK